MLYNNAQIQENEFNQDTIQKCENCMDTDNNNNTLNSLNSNDYESSGDYYEYDYQCNQYVEAESGTSTSEDSQSTSKDSDHSDIEMFNNHSFVTKTSDDDECMESMESMDSIKTANQKQCILETKGYIYHKKIAKTLQGEIFEAINTNNNNEIVVIKKAEKNLVTQNITIRDGKKIKIEEDILREIEIMRYLNSFENGNDINNNGNKLPSEHIKLLDLFEDDENIFVVTEHGGTDFFQWICFAHKQLESGQLSFKYWWKNIKFLFKQMIDYVLWLQNTMDICHLDISLENMLLQNGEYFYNSGKFTYSQQIKFCDFGLSEYFDITKNPSFKCNKHVGKESYMAPEVYARSQSFDARKADAWSLGVVLFIMISGAPAYSKPDILNDTSFQYIIYNKIPNLLNNWGRLHYINPMMLDLLQKIFVLDPNKRLTVQQIRNHPWLQ